MPLRLLSPIFIILAYSCGSNKIDYHEKLEGTWIVSNASEILKYNEHMPYSMEEIKKSKVVFQSDGKMVCSMAQRNQTGTWNVSEDGNVIYMKGDSLPFDESLPLDFENEQSIIIMNNGKKIILKKIDGL